MVTAPASADPYFLFSVIQVKVGSLSSVALLRTPFITTVSVSETIVYFVREGIREEEQDWMLLIVASSRTKKVADNSCFIGVKTFGFN